MIRKEAVVAILGSPVAYYAAFAKVLGGVEAGIFTSQFFYWYGKGHDPNGWIYKTQSEIEEETGLTRRNQETARKKLRQLGVLEERYAGMPAKLYYRVNLDILFPLMNEWFAIEVLGSEVEHGSEDNKSGDSGSDSLGPQNKTQRTTDTSAGNQETSSSAPDQPSPTRVNPQDGGFRQPRMYDPANQGCANPPSKDVQSRQPRMADPDKHGCANPPDMDGGFRHANTKTTTETTTQNTSRTTTKTTTGLSAYATQQGEADRAHDDSAEVDVSVPVPVSVMAHSPNGADPTTITGTLPETTIDEIPEWIVKEFRHFLGNDRSLNRADKQALAALALFPEYVIQQAFDAAAEKLADPSQEPIRSLGKWLVGTAKYKMEEESIHGSSISRPPEPEDVGFFVVERDGLVEEATEGVRSAPEPELQEHMSEEELFWASILTELELRVPRETYDRWVRTMQLLSTDEDVYVVGLADERSKDWVENRFTNMLRQTLSSRMGRPVRVRFETVGDGEAGA